MARKRVVLSASVSLATSQKVYEIVDAVAAETTLPVHPGIVIDAAIRTVSERQVMEAMGMRVRPQRPPDPPDLLPPFPKKGASGVRH